ncbi:MAG: TrkH family potassium uptake protein [Clostridiaceae bacterium]
MQTRIKNRTRLTPVRILALGFAAVIFAGAVLLALPISAADGRSTPFIDCFFVSTSATCVTGLVTVDTGTHWSYFGKTVILFLIELGGLGFMSFATLFALIFGKVITLKERLLMQEALNSLKLQGMVSLVRYVLIFTFSVQAVAALILSTQFIPQFGLAKGIYYSIFHSVSAFCNAGIDLFGNYSSVTSYYDNPVVIITIGSLIIIGGMGFYVWQELYRNRFRRLSVNTRLVLIITAILIIGGTILMFLFEVNNPATIKNMPLKDQMINAWFAAVTPRTAGFNSISTADMSPAGRFLTIILMFIGGSPGSTAGGIKTTTFGLLLFTVISIVRGRQDTEIFKKRISRELVTRAITIAFIAVILVTLVVMILCVTETGAPLEYLLYEAVSAFGTVGLTLGLTPNLSDAGKIVLALTMYCGRLGPLTLAIAFAKRSYMKGIKYPEDKIIVG